jgi:curli biogenesis system outer membrane secretion channel CsgG
MSRLLIVTAIAAGLATGAAAQQKRRVAVLDFEYATVRSSVQAVFGGDQDIGKGIADLIVEKLVNGGTYSVIERKAIEKVMAEQNFSNSDRADSQSAAKIGRLLGVDAIIMGSITQFGRDDKSTGVGGGALSRATGRFGIGGVKRTSAKSVVGLSARMVNIDTAEILATAKGLGEASRQGTALEGAGGGTVVGGGNVDMRSKNFANTIIGEAVTKAVGQLAQELDHNSARLPQKAVVIDGLVADVTGNSVIVNQGSRVGVKVGDKLQVRRKVRDVRDPASGKILRSIEDKIGEITITEVDEVSSVGTYSGAGAPKVGDVVKNN